MKLAAFFVVNCVPLPGTSKFPDDEWAAVTRLVLRRAKLKNFPQLPQTSRFQRLSKALRYVKLNHSCHDNDNLLNPDESLPAGHRSVSMPEPTRAIRNHNGRNRTIVACSIAPYKQRRLPSTCVFFSLHLRRPPNVFGPEARFAPFGWVPASEPC